MKKAKKLSIEPRDTFTKGVNIEQAIVEFIETMELDNAKEVIDYTLGLYERCKR